MVAVVVLGFWGLGLWFVVLLGGALGLGAYLVVVETAWRHASPWAARLLELVATYVPLLAWLACAVVIDSRSIGEVARFCEISAQVIPVLLLAVVIERRTLESAARSGDGLLGPVAVVTIGLALGEYQALRALLTDTDTVEFGYIVGALVSGFLAVMLQSAQPPTGLATGAKDR